MSLPSTQESLHSLDTPLRPQETLDVSGVKKTLDALRNEGKSYSGDMLDRYITAAREGALHSNETIAQEFAKIAQLIEEGRSAEIGIILDELSLKLNLGTSLQQA